MYYFTDDCLTGMKQIDDEHRELFRILNELHELFANEFIEDKYDHTRELLDRLRDYTQCHFTHEEAYMESIAHPELELQRRQHNAFTAKISEMDAILPSGSQQAFLDDLLQYLVTWLYRHIISSDMMIGKLIPAKEWEEKTDLRFTEEYLTAPLAARLVVSRSFCRLFRPTEIRRPAVERNSRGPVVGRFIRSLAFARRRR